MYEITIDIDSSWNTGGNGIIKIKNISGRDIYNWRIKIFFSVEISSFWELEYSNDTITGKSWNKTLRKGQTITSGFSFFETKQISTITFSIDNPPIEVESQNIIFEDNELINIPLEQNVINTNNIINNNQTKKKIIGYFSEWSIYQREYAVEKIPVQGLTHISYAFMFPNLSQEDYNKFIKVNKFPPKPYNPNVPEGTLVYHDGYAASINIPKLQKLKRENPQIQVGISVGGWTLSMTFSKIAGNQQLRKTFIESSVDYIIEKGFDYLSIDWEFVGLKGMSYNYVDAEKDGENFTIMMKELRDYMDLKSPNKRLGITVAAGCNPKTLQHYGGAKDYIDTFELMCYDYYGGSWTKKAGNMTGLYYNPNDKDGSESFTNDSAIKMAISLGYKPENILMGIPFYGRSWDNLQLYNPDGNEIFGETQQMSTSTLSGDYGEPALSSYRDIKKNVDNGNFTEYYDDVACATWAKNNQNTTISYDNEKSLKNKMKYINNNKLGGVLIWEISDDVRTYDDSLLKVINDNLSNNESFVDIEDIIDNASNEDIIIENNIEENKVDNMSLDLEEEQNINSDVIIEILNEDESEDEEDIILTLSTNKRLVIEPNKPLKIIIRQ
jgi:GH18 family chitinase